MVGSKQIAEYVAATTLGLEASLVQGKVVVEQVVCDGAPETNAACDILDLGDTITAIDAVPTPTLTELAEQIQGRAPGETITVTVVPHGQDDQSQTVDRTVTLMEDPDTPGRPIIGIVPADTRTVDLPFSIGISTSDIGGPSAGLAFTLAILDELTEGDLTGRGKVAATGTINEDGTVGAIGALVQKAVAVRDVGASLFLVPSSQSEDELAEARRAAGSKVTIVPVATLAEALAALAENGGDPLPPRS
jgi:PDZ domain-containing protein